MFIVGSSVGQDSYRNIPFIIFPEEQVVYDFCLPGWIWDTEFIDIFF